MASQKLFSFFVNTPSPPHHSPAAPQESSPCGVAHAYGSAPVLGPSLWVSRLDPDFAMIF